MTNTAAQAIVDKTFQTGEVAERIAAAKAQTLDTFLAYAPAERARVWRSMDETSKATLVSAMLIRAYDDWSQESIDLWVSRYNQRWGN